MPTKKELQEQIVELKEVKIYWTLGDGALIVDSLYQETKDLKEQNEKLKEEISNLKDYNDKLECGLVTFECAECDSLKEQNEKLKAEIDELEEKQVILINTDDIAEVVGEDKEQYRNECCAYTLGHMILENKKLKERLSIMKATASVHIDDINQIHQDYGNMVRKLEEEIKKLKENQ